MGEELKIFGANRINVGEELKIFGANRINVGEELKIFGANRTRFTLRSVGFGVKKRFV